MKLNNINILKLFKRLHLIRLYSKVITPFFIGNQCSSVSESYKYLRRINEDKGKSSVSFNQIEKPRYDLQVIVPAYNAETTIKECLYSILNQETKYSFLVVCIDDGSTDETYTLLNSISNAFNNLLIIHQENKGFSGARNAGLKKIFSKYIMFVDSDDKLEEGAIDKLLRAAFDNNSDIVEGSFRCVYRNKVQFLLSHNTERVKDPFNTLYGYPWGKVYRSSLFADVVFPENYWFEDTAMMYRIWPKCKSVITLNDFVYRYEDNFSGITHKSKGKTKTIDTLWVTNKLLLDVKKSNKELLNKESIYNFTLKQIITNTLRLGYLGDSIVRANFVISRHLLNEFFPDIKTNRKELLSLENSLFANNFRDFILSVYTY